MILGLIFGAQLAAWLAVAAWARHPWMQNWGGVRVVLLGVLAGLAGLGAIDTAPVFLIWLVFFTTPVLFGALSAFLRMSQASGAASGGAVFGVLGAIAWAVTIPVVKWEHDLSLLTVPPDPRLVQMLGVVSLSTAVMAFAFEFLGALCWVVLPAASEA